MDARRGSGAIVVVWVLRTHTTPYGTKFIYSLAIHAAFSSAMRACAHSHRADVSSMRAMSRSHVAMMSATSDMD